MGLQSGHASWKPRAGPLGQVVAVVVLVWAAAEFLFCRAAATRLCSGGVLGTVSRVEMFLLLLSRACTEPRSSLLHTCQQALGVHKELGLLGDQRDVPHPVASWSAIELGEEGASGGTCKVVALVCPGHCSG